MQFCRERIHLDRQLSDLHHLNHGVKSVGQRHVAICHRPQRQLGSVKNIVHARLLADRREGIRYGSDVPTADGRMKGPLINLQSDGRKVARRQAHFWTQGGPYDCPDRLCSAIMLPQGV